MFLYRAQVSMLCQLKSFRTVLVCEFCAKISFAKYADAFTLNDKTEDVKYLLRSEVETKHFRYATMLCSTFGIYMHVQDISLNCHALLRITYTICAHTPSRIHINSTSISTNLPVSKTWTSMLTIWLYSSPVQ